MMSPLLISTLEKVILADPLELRLSKAIHHPASWSRREADMLVVAAETGVISPEEA